MIKNEFVKHIKEVDGITSNDMFPEWNDTQERKVRNELRRIFGMKRLTNHRNESYTMYTFSSIEDFFGLPYTSSSSFAMYGNTNTRFCFDIENKYNVDCFGLGKDSKVYVFCTDAEENEKVYQII